MSKKPTVLVVDDDPLIVSLFRDILALEGCEMIAAQDGEQALEALELGTPDMAILDVMMPGRSGIDVLRAMRADPETRTTPVLIVSAKRDEVSVWDGLRNGCDFYITKPFDPSEVAHHVRSLLNRF